MQDAECKIEVSPSAMDLKYLIRHGFAVPPSPEGKACEVSPLAMDLK